MEVAWYCVMIKRSPFRYFKTSPEIIRLAVIMYMRFPLLLRNVEDLLHERGDCQIKFDLSRVCSVGIRIFSRSN